MKKILVILAVLAMAAPAMGLSEWVGTGDWTDDATNWSNGIPGNETARIQSGTVTIDTEVLTDQGNITMANALTGGGDVSFVMTGGLYSGGQYFAVGEDNVNVNLTLSGDADMDLTGSITMLYYGQGWGNQYTNTTSTITMSGSSTLDAGGSLYFGNGYAGSAPEGAGQEYRISLSGTSVLTVGSITVNDTTAGVRTLDLAGGSLVVAGDVSLPEGAGEIVVSGYGANAGGGVGVAYTKTWDGTYSIFAGIGGAAAIPGDFDSDNDVDGVDFGFWQSGFPTASGASLTDGDADNDGDVDGVDFGIWQANYPTNLGGAAAIPEPTTLGLLLIGGLVWLRRRR